MNAILVADNFINSSAYQNDRINTLLEEKFQLTVRQRIYEDERGYVMTNQSCVADIAAQCETRRLDNNNFRLDLETHSRHEHILER